MKEKKNKNILKNLKINKQKIKIYARCVNNFNK